jgi:hypothetical protein
MPRVMIKCPNTNKFVPTGFALDKASFENPSYILGNNTVRCPACGKDHTWSKADAILEDAKSS